MFVVIIYTIKSVCRHDNHQERLGIPDAMIAALSLANRI